MNIAMFGIDFSVAQILLETVEVALIFSQDVLNIINTSSISVTNLAFGGSNKEKNSCNVQSTYNII